MKTPLTYGFIGALAGALLNLAFYFTGFHDSAEKLPTAQIAGGVLGLCISIACLVLAIREKRANALADMEWGYGSAFGAGTVTSIFLCLFGSIFTFLYMAFINSGFSDMILAGEQAKMEAKGMSATQIANAEPIMRKMMSPAASAIMQLIAGFVFCLILTAIISIFLRKPREGALGSELPPPVA